MQDFFLFDGKQRQHVNLASCKKNCDKLQSLSEICRKSVLGYPDSNQERQDQNLQCYHYTIPQFLAPRNRFLDCGCKGNAFF